MSRHGKVPAGNSDASNPAIGVARATTEIGLLSRARTVPEGIVMRQNMERVIEAFLAGKPAKGDAKNTCSTDGTIVYSYKMKIAERLKNGTIVIVPRENGPSRTTRAQIDALVQAFDHAKEAKIVRKSLGVAPEIIDRQPRYAPRTVLVIGHGEVPVTSYVAHPPGAHPVGCPLVATCTALEMRTAYGSRWWGVEKAWINAELRMVVSGFPAACEIRRKWRRVAPKDAAGAPKDPEVKMSSVNL